MTRSTDTSARRGGLRSTFAALEHRDFRRFFWAALVSNSGTWFQGVAGPFVIFAITDAPRWLGIAAFSQVGTMALMGPVAGPLADRIPRRRILLVCQSLLAVVSFGWFLLWSSGVRTIGFYIALAVTGGVIAGFNMPAWQAFVSDLVPRESLMNAITLNSTQFNAARLFGPSLAGLVLSVAGPSWCFLANTISYVGVVAVLATISDKPPVVADARESVLRAFRAGGRYVLRRRDIAAPYIAAGILGLLGGTLTSVGLVVFAERVYDVDGVRYGLLIAAFGAGSIIAAPFVASIGPRVRRSRMMTAGLATYGIGELVLSATDRYLIGVLGVLVAGASHITVATATNSTIQMKTSEVMRGRVMALYLMTLTIAMPVGGLTQGLLLEVVAPRRLMMVMGLLFIIGALALRASGLALLSDADGDGTTGVRTSGPSPAQR